MPFMSPLSQHIISRCRFKKIACLLVQVCQKPTPSGKIFTFYTKLQQYLYLRVAGCAGAGPFWTQFGSGKKERKYHSNSIYIKRHI